MLTLKHPQATRLHEAISSVADHQAADNVLSELPLSKTPSEAQKAVWARASCDAVADRFGKDASKIRRGCHCTPPSARVQEMRKLLASCVNLEEFARRATEKAKGTFTIAFRDGTLSLCYPRCYCSFVKHANTKPPALWCDCSLGYAEDMFSQVFGREVKATLRKSVAQGDEYCEIAIE